MLAHVAFFALLVIGGQCDQEEDLPVVKTPLGKVRGYFKQSLGDRKYSAFEGIPYAKSPVGERRFQEPSAVEPWSGTWDAFYQIKCVQTEMMKLQSVTGQEDCLYVNVYVPRESPHRSDKLDVIVHFHGGMFMYGDGHSYSHPEFLMDKDVVLVTLNYRLGLFGFLSTGDDVVPGNNGLKDQVMALQWIQKNIASFGGNPKSVTLTGLSAGGSSVHLHFLSHMSKGLFHRGFSQSGVALNPWVIQEAPVDKAKLLAEAVGCPNAYNQVMVQCLKQRPFKHLIRKMPIFYDYLMAPYSPFGPVVEKGSNPFLNKHPYELLASGQVQDLPWLVSNTIHEGLFPGAYLRYKLDTIDSDWDTVAAFLLNYNTTLPITEWKSTANTIRKYYLGDEKINDNNYLKLVQIFSDRLFVVDSEIAAKLQANANKSPVYYYRFGFSGQQSQNNTVGHGDDIQYFFFNTFERKSLNESDLRMKDAMLHMLVSFAKNGKPVFEGIDWKPTKGEKLTFLQIDGYEAKDVKVETVDELAPKSFWKSLGFKENENLVGSVKEEL